MQTECVILSLTLTKIVLIPVRALAPNNNSAYNFLDFIEVKNFCNA